TGRGAPVLLFVPGPGVGFAGGRSPRPTPAVGDNPMPGAAVTYWLKDRPAGGVTLTLLDSAGTVLRTFTGTPASSARDDSVTYAPSDSAVPVRAGTNRFVWNLRGPDA